MPSVAHFTTPVPHSTNHRPLLRRLVQVCTTALALAALLLGAASMPAQADTASHHLQPTHPQRDYAGSTVAAHEGTTGSSTFRPLDAQIPGMDVSRYQGNVDWASAAANGAQFAYVKASEGISYTSPYFSQQYNGAFANGLVRGAYHFALPNVSSGADQANHFISNGGGWSADGMTLPPALDIEYNPYGDSCYGLSQSDMVSWIRDFSDTVYNLTGRHPTIYTTTNWWSTCTGNDGTFGATNPLWIARYSDSVGTLPNGWSSQTFWQYSTSGTFPGDQDYFNGDRNALEAFALG